MQSCIPVGMFVLPMHQHASVLQRLLPSSCMSLPQRACTVSCSASCTVSYVDSCIFSCHASCTDRCIDSCRAGHLHRRAIACNCVILEPALHLLLWQFCWLTAVAVQQGCQSLCDALLTHHYSPVVTSLLAKVYISRQPKPLL